MNTTNETRDNMLKAATKLYRDYVGWEQRWDESGWKDLYAKENRLISYGKVRGAAEVMAAALGIQRTDALDLIETAVTGC